jgi:hypothetical protein
LLDLFAACNGGACGSGRQHPGLKCGGYSNSAIADQISTVHGTLSLGNGRLAILAIVGILSRACEEPPFYPTGRSRVNYVLEVKVIK